MKDVKEIVREFEENVFKPEDKGGWLVPYEGADEHKMIKWLRVTLTERDAALVAETADKIKRLFNGYGGMLGFTRKQLLELLTNTDRV